MTQPLSRPGGFFPIVVTNGSPTIEITSTAVASEYLLLVAQEVQQSDRIIDRAGVLYRGDRGGRAERPHRREQSGRRLRNLRPVGSASRAASHYERDRVGAIRTKSGTGP